MTAWRWAALQRAVVALLVAALLLPSLNGCVTATPSTIVLAAVVVDGVRRARPDETALVRIVRDNAMLPGVENTELRRGDHVTTGPNAYAVIRYPNGSELILRPGSSGRIGSLTEFIGELFVKVRGAFSVSTTYVSASARGTAFLVRAAPGGATSVVVFDGKVSIESRIGAWGALVAEPGQSVIAHPRAPQAAPASPEELERTREWVDRIEKLAPPPQRASGTGIAVAIGIAALVAAILGARDRDRDRPNDKDSTETNTPPATRRVIK